MSKDMVRFTQPMDFRQMPSFTRGEKDEPTIKNHHLVLVKEEEEEEVAAVVEAAEETVAGVEDKPHVLAKH